MYISKYVYLPLLNKLKLICLHNFGFQAFLKKKPMLVGKFITCTYPWLYKKVSKYST